MRGDTVVRKIVTVNADGLIRSRSAAVLVLTGRCDADRVRPLPKVRRNLPIQVRHAKGVCSHRLLENKSVFLVVNADIKRVVINRLSLGVEPQHPRVQSLPWLVDVFVGVEQQVAWSMKLHRTLNRVRNQPTLQANCQIPTLRTHFPRNRKLQCGVAGPICRGHGGDFLVPTIVVVPG